MILQGDLRSKESCRADRVTQNRTHRVIIAYNVNRSVKHWCQQLLCQQISSRCGMYFYGKTNSFLELSATATVEESICAGNDVSAMPKIYVKLRMLFMLLPPRIHVSRSQRNGYAIRAPSEERRTASKLLMLTVLMRLILACSSTTKLFRRRKSPPAKGKSLVRRQFQAFGSESSSKLPQGEAKSKSAPAPLR